MVLIVKKLVQGYFILFGEKRDPRVDNYFLMSSPFYPALICLGYLYLIYDFLPKFMKNRPPYKLDRVLIVFNAVQVLVNGYLTYHAAKEVTTMNWYCSPIDFSVTPHNKFVINLVYLYFVLKLSDLLDTIFFILRGKTKQVSFLHVYHHFGMIVLSWTGVKFLAGGHSIFLGFGNAMVHTFMYFYYLLTVWKPEYKASIWWKKHITHLQLMQFLFFFFIYGQLLFRPECTYPKLASYFIVPQSLFMVTLFGDFYWKTYIKPQKKPISE